MSSDGDQKTPQLDHGSSSVKPQADVSKSLHYYHRTKSEQRDLVAVRFAGDSGDGMQLAGDRFATVAAVDGSDVLTFPDYPAEIRAPAGSVAGVSGYQINFGDVAYTPGDQIDILVAMNPAAVKANLPDLRTQGVIILNLDAFTEENIKKAGFDANPLEDGTLSRYRVFRINITTLTKQVLKGFDLTTQQVERCKNFYALGITSWLMHISTERTMKWIENKFKNKPIMAEANKKVFKAGFEFGDTQEVFDVSYIVKKRGHKQPGLYKYINGNSAVALGLVAAANKAGLDLFLGSYPITPASEILHELSNYKNFPVRVFQAEDEIAAVGASIGASFAGALAATSTSGPGLALKSEFINLAVIAELPLVIINVQRGGPSTGLPTKSEQADLFQALYGRNGESPLVVIAAASPSDCFYSAVEASYYAVKYMTPVILLTDGYLANGSEPLRIPELSELPDINPRRNENPLMHKDKYFPYMRDPYTLARPWVVPGTPGYEHRIGGLEKEDVTGAVSYAPKNHEKMVHIRDAKISQITREYDPTEIYGSDEADLLVIGWGSTFGVIRQAVSNLKKKGIPVASVHLRHIHPFPADLKEIMSRYKKILVAENNLGQLNFKLKAEYLVETELLTKVQGLPFRVSEIEAKIQSLLGAN